MDAKETSIYTAILITSVVLGIIIVYFVISIIRQQRKILQLHKLNILAELATLEKERARVASDLHDEIGPMLAAVKLRINSFELTEKEDLVQIDKTNKHIDDVLNRIREISFDLMPNTLLSKGLIVAINQFVDYISKNNKIDIIFSSVDIIALNEHKAINLYRIVQEVIHNTIKHSNATNLLIYLKTEKNKVILETKDNGKGFDYVNKIKNNTGFGLRNMASRTEIIGGELFLESENGNGTHFIFEIPLQ